MWGRIICTLVSIMHTEVFDHIDPDKGMFLGGNYSFSEIKYLFCSHQRFLGWLHIWLPYHVYIYTYVMYSKSSAVSARQKENVSEATTLMKYLNKNRFFRFFDTDVVHLTHLFIES